MRFIKQKDPHHRRAQSADPCPDRIGGANGQCFEGQGQKIKTEDHSRDGDKGWKPPGESLSVFESDCPYHFKDSGNDQISPCHGISSSR